MIGAKYLHEINIMTSLRIFLTKDNIVPRYVDLSDYFNFTFLTEEFEKVYQKTIFSLTVNSLKIITKTLNLFYSVYVIKKKSVVAVLSVIRKVTAVSHATAE